MRTVRIWNSYSGTTSELAGSFIIGVCLCAIYLSNEASLICLRNVFSLTCSICCLIAVTHNNKIVSTHFSNEKIRLDQNSHLLVVNTSELFVPNNHLTFSHNAK